MQYNNYSSQPTYSGQDSGFKKRLLVILGGGLGLILFIWIVFGVILKPDTGALDRLVVVAAEQNDIIDIAEEYQSALKAEDLVALTVGSRLVILSDQQDLVKKLGDRGVSVEAPDLAAAKDESVRDSLESARQLNNLDDVFRQEYTTKLKAYQNLLVSTYDKAESDGQRDTLDAYFANIDALISD